MNSIYTLLFATLINLACTNTRPNQSPGRITGRWLPVMSIISCVEDGKKTYEKADSNFSPMDVMVFKENGALDDGGQRYDGYTIDLKTRELTLAEANGDGITFKIRTMNQDQLIIYREDEEIYRNKKRQMKLEIYFRRL